MNETEYLMSNSENAEHLLNSVKQLECIKKEEDIEIPPMLLADLIEWLRNKGISDSDIVDCMLHICQKQDR